VHGSTKRSILCSLGACCKSARKTKDRQLPIGMSTSTREPAYWRSGLLSNPVGQKANTSRSRHGAEIPHLLLAIPMLHASSAESREETYLSVTLLPSPAQSGLVSVVSTVLPFHLPQWKKGQTVNNRRPLTFESLTRQRVCVVCPFGQNTPRSSSTPKHGFMDVVEPVPQLVLPETDETHHYQRQRQGVGGHGQG